MRKGWIGVGGLAIVTGLLAAPAMLPASPPTGRLPLRDGEYAVDCQRGYESMESIGYYSGALAPMAEGQEGYCELKRVSVKAGVYSGSTACDSGTRISTDLGTYRFSYRITGNTSFVSKGKRYKWCAPHR